MRGHGHRDRPLAQVLDQHHGVPIAARRYGQRTRKVESPALAQRAHGDATQRRHDLLGFGFAAAAVAAAVYPLVHARAQLRPPVTPLDAFARLCTAQVPGPHAVVMLAQYGRPQRRGQHDASVVALPSIQHTVDGLHELPLVLSSRLQVGAHLAARLLLPDDFHRDLLSRQHLQDRRSGERVGDHVFLAWAMLHVEVELLQGKCPSVQSPTGIFVGHEPF